MDLVKRIENLKTKLSKMESRLYDIDSDGDEYEDEDDHEPQQKTKVKGSNKINK